MCLLHESSAAYYLVFWDGASQPQQRWMVVANNFPKSIVPAFAMVICTILSFEIKNIAININNKRSKLIKV